MKKLIALLLLSPIAQADFADELYDAMKDNLTHIVCDASGEKNTTFGSLEDTKQIKQKDYFSFTDGGFLWAKLDKLAYLLTLIQLPSLEEAGKLVVFDERYEVKTFNADTIGFIFAASEKMLQNLSEDGEEYREYKMEWLINRNSGDYTTATRYSVYSTKFTDMKRVSETLYGSCETHDPDKKKF